MTSAASPTGGEPCVQVEGLTKLFGSTRALDAVDLSVTTGEVYGFLGPNGAGKTTAIRIMLGLARPTAGRVRIFGGDIGSPAVRTRVGYLPDVAEFYGWMQAPDFLRLSGRLFRLTGAPLERRIHSLLGLAGLTGVRQPIRAYSRGMKQRLGIAQALINAPDLLILDEPTSALDPIGRKDVLDMIAGLRGRATVFFSTHILEDAQRVCDSVAILDHGRVLAAAPLEQLTRTRAATRASLRVTGWAAELVARIKAEPWASGCARDGELITIGLTDQVAARYRVPALLAELGIGLESFALTEPSLEDVFLSYVTPDAAAVRP